MDRGRSIKLLLRLIIYFFLSVVAIILGYFIFGTELIGFGLFYVLGIHFLYVSWKYMKEAASDTHHESYPGQLLLLLAGSSEDRVRTITKITGVVNVVLGLIFIGINFVALSHVPEALPKFNQEPEDFFLLSGIMTILGLLSAAFFFSGVILVRNRGNFFFRVREVTRLLIVGVAILTACAVASFIPPPNGVNYPALRLLLIPAVVLAWSVYLMRGLPR